MFKTTLAADIKTDAAAVTEEIAARAERAGVGAPHLELLKQELGSVLAELVETGKQTAALGSQMTAERTVKGKGYAVRLVFRANDKRSFFAKVFDGLKGR